MQLNTDIYSKWKRTTNEKDKEQNKIIATIIVKVKKEMILIGYKLFIFIVIAIQKKIYQLQLLRRYFIKLFLSDY